MMENMNGQVQPFSIRGATERVMHSKEGLAYRIMIWLPENTAPAAGFPIYYLLDGNAVFGTFTETVRMKSNGPRKQEPAIVVGIGYPSNAPFDTDRRFIDYTIPAHPDELISHRRQTSWPENGGIELFLDFIESVLKPAISELAPINTGRQALFGHSLGGFCTLYTLFTRPEMFHYYAAGSPSVWWKDNAISKYAASFRPAHAMKRRLFIGIGTEEPAHMISGNEKLFRELQQMDQSVLETEFKCFEGESHISVLLPFISQVVRAFQQMDV